MPIQLISTDFDGTIFAEFEDPPIAPAFVDLVTAFQRQGGRWVINTGRDMGSLLETLGRAGLTVHPDALVLVEREIHLRRDGRYEPLQEWNEDCTRAHRELFRRVARDLPGLIRHLERRHRATLYQDAFSPLCAIAETEADANRIQAELEEYARSQPHLAVVRNDVYIRFAHEAFNKGTALSELARRWNLLPQAIVAAGDHWNDLPMLDASRAAWLVAPANAIAEVQAAVRKSGGFVSRLPQGDGIAEGLNRALAQAASSTAR